MKKSVLLLVFLLLSSLFVNAQITNEFIKKGSVVLNPNFRMGHLPNEKNTYGLGAQLAFLPFNRFEIKPGAMYFWGYSRDFEVNTAVRYYLLKTKFTVFPEVYSSYSFFSSKFFDYNLAFGAGYYGIFKRIGIDLIVRYYPPLKFFFPDAKIKILLWK